MIKSIHAWPTMKTLRQVHLYLGCIFAPLIIYFSISGAWQVFRLNDVPKENPTAIRSVLHAISNPHTHSTFPGKDPRAFSSQGFRLFAALMGVGMVITSILGILLALRFSKRPVFVVICLLAGLLIPVCTLFISAF